VAAVLMFILGGLSLSMLDAGARSELLRMAARVTEPAPAAHPSVSRRAAPASENTLQPLPTLPTNGVIELASNGRYAAADILTDRPLTIRSTGGMTTIVVGDKPMRITAQSLQLTDLRFVSTDSVDDAMPTDGGKPASSGESATPQILLAARAQQVAIDNCRFEQPTGTTPGTTIAWKVADEADPAGGRFVARNTAFAGNCRAIDVHAMPRLVGFDNCLKRGDGPLLRMMNGNRSSPLRVHLRQSTLRDCGAMIQWTAAAATDAIQPTLIVVENSVFRLRSESSGLLDFVSPPPTGWGRLLQINGEGSLLTPQTPLVTANSVPVAVSNLRVEGLMLDEFEFAADSGGPQASEVVATQAPRSTATLPGIDASRFPVKSPAAVVRQAAHEYNSR
jgi:eukaryotic-like serine/threonine-protein kinase